jgi:hypothetical protein
VSEPVLFQQRVVLDLDNSECDLHFWRHERYLELLCLGPTHMAKSWKKQISKLKLSADNEKHLISLIWRFALRTELCDCDELDSEWEELTRVALRMAGITKYDDLVLLPRDLRLSTKTSFASQTEEVGQSSVSSHQDAECSRDDESILLAEIIQCVDSISVRVDELKSADVQSGDKIQLLKAELDAVLLKICRRGVELESESTCLLTSFSRLNGKIQKNRKKPAKEDQVVTDGLVLEVMQHIYSLSHTWCQRVVCSGHTMQRKSSTWSEILNSSIKRHVKSRNMLNGTYMLSSFVSDVDQWVHELFQKSFLGNKMGLDKSSQILNHTHVSILQQVLCNGALNKLIDTLIPNTVQGEYSVIAELSKSTLCRTMKTRLSAFQKSFEILDPEVKFFQVTPKHHLWKCCGKRDDASTREFTQADDKVHSCLDLASKIANRNSLGSTLAVYFPSGEQCKITFFNKSRPPGFGIPFFCSCQGQPSSGLPCEHMLAYILLPNHKIPRSVWNIIWLCHPSFMRCHMVASGACRSAPSGGLVIPAGSQAAA